MQSKNQGVILGVSVENTVESTVQLVFYSVF